MKKKTIIQSFWILLITIVTSILSYLAQSSIIFDKLKNHGIIGPDIQIKVLQDICLWVGIGLSAILLSLNLIITKYRKNSLLNQRNSLIKMNKSLLAVALGNSVIDNEASIDIRIFIPKNKVRYKIYDFFHLDNLPRKFVINNIDLIAEEDSTKGLQFEVYPKPQGLVGECFTKKVMVFDDDLVHTNKTDYHLNENQIARTSQLKWSICNPVFDASGRIIAVIALDGKTSIHLNDQKEEELRNHMSAFSHMLYDSVPQLFKG